MSAQVFAAISMLLSWSNPKIVPLGSYLSKSSQEIYLRDSAGLKKKTTLFIPHSADMG